MSVPANSLAYPCPISMKMYKEQRQRLGESLHRAFPEGGHAAVLQAASEVPINSTDCNYLFVQESYYYYLFGTELPEAYGAVLADGTGIVFIARLPAEYATWMGPLPTPEGVKAQLAMDEVHYVDEMEKVLKAHGVHTAEVMHGTNSDSGLHTLQAKLPEGSSLTQSTSFLFNTLTAQRGYKTAMEAEVLKYVCKVSSDAHVTVMRMAKPGMSQHHLESTFLHEVYYKGGCRRVSYTCICATGHHGATLHYPDNNALIENGSMALLDMGGNYRGYAADITCSFPVNGKFTEAQKIIYNAVLDAHDKVMRAMKPGVQWVDMHLLAIRTICTHLIAAGLLKGDLDVMMKKEIMQYFQPHGLGHLIGMDVHDVGGYMEGYPERPTKKDCCRLRTARPVEEGMYMTIEPGCYFNAALLAMAKQNSEVVEHLNLEKIEEFADFGGVRIESDVLVTKDGVVNYTVVPRTVEEIERTMAGAEFSKDIEVYHN
ncbi:aminopeptidase P putativemetallo-peptidase Clan MG Family M24 [Leptomonas pyrrhocoris]|uniref:Xaa-Pro dipeptidase n=1 Tax=Leptomonas pyrrhocoris TaxID=157538 RepID=A0A0N0VHM8_LEPPY|nr:aminopeptidase P putativemetallo-peptidase Clan MG Family M24 [Leptomonas pyrrhocoris]KPA86201.1 aminopeptidase P putativemetallo-peptidase Clan MG Family M24 [Leptomonas pyrrhocoris]|eukprot:XP_015664640.1 aminopeptidase P putativemetallo-peptidase Clan MG Family M24 [Leptomonas pyrrhocoris]